MRAISSALASIVLFGIPQSNALTEKQVVDFPLNGLTGEYNLHVYSPTGNGTHPVIFFVGGFAGNVFVTWYGDLLTRIAQRGYVVVGMDHTHFPSYFEDARGFLQVLEWAKEKKLQEQMVKHGLNVVPDVEGKAAVMAQSAGNHVAGQAMKDSCSIAKAMVMIDPYDGVDPYRIIKSEDLITPGTKLNFSMPALILDNRLDPIPAIFGSPACVPPNMGTSRFMAAWDGPVWNINATQYGHVDCLNDGYIPATGWVCKSLKETNKTLYRMVLADAAVNFLDAILHGEPDKLDRLENSSYFPIDVTLKRDLNGLSHDEIKPGCTNTAQVVVV